MKLVQARRANLLCNYAAGDGVEDAVEEVDGLGSAVAAADFKCLIDYNRKGRGLEADKLGNSHAKEIAVNGGHAVNAPVRGVAGDERIDFLLARYGDSEKIFGKAAHFGLDGIAGFPERRTNLFGGLAADVRLK
jgi:hypothetical protein